MEIYIEYTYCFECGARHWLEITRTGREICHGQNYTGESATTYTRRSGRGRRVLEKCHPANLTPIWQIEARETIDQNQDW